MPPTNRGAIAPLLAPDLRKVFFETGKERPLEYEQVCNVVDMGYNPVTDQQIAGLGAMPKKDEGTPFTLDELLIGGSKSYTASAWGMGVEITWEAWRDELYGAFREMIRGMQKATRHRQEIQAWANFNNAFTSGTGFDGSYLCATNHALIGGGTWANAPTVAIGFSVSGLQAMILDFEGMTDERGLPRLMAPTRILLHPSKKFTAREIFGSGGKPYTAQNEINSLVQEDLSYMICHYLTSSSAWFATTNKEETDINFLWRDYPIFDCFDDPRTKSAVATAYQRFTTGFGSARGIWGSSG